MHLPLVLVTLCLIQCAGKRVIVLEAGTGVLPAMCSKLGASTVLGAFHTCTCSTYRNFTRANSFEAIERSDALARMALQTLATNNCDEVAVTTLHTMPASAKDMPAEVLVTGTRLLFV